MDINATMVKELREKTGVGMMMCKKALQETEGDISAAIEHLRKKGQETAAKRSGRAAKEGKISTKIDPQLGVILEVNSETDFVARNEDFGKFVENILEILSGGEVASVNELMEKKIQSDLTVKDSLNEIVVKIGENISIRRFKKIDYDPATSRLFSYIHGNGKIGVLLKLDSDNPQSDEFEALGKDLTLHITAANPLSIERDGLDATAIEKEREIYKTQALNEGKPEKIVDKIV